MLVHFSFSRNSTVEFSFRNEKHYYYYHRNRTLAFNSIRIPANSTNWSFVFNQYCNERLDSRIQNCDQNFLIPPYEYINSINNSILPHNSIVGWLVVKSKLREMLSLSYLFMQILSQKRWILNKNFSSAIVGCITPKQIALSALSSLSCAYFWIRFVCL